MAKVRPNNEPVGYDYQLVSGQVAQQAISEEGATFYNVFVTAVGGAGSFIEVYDGPVASANRVAYYAGTTLGAGIPAKVWCPLGIYVKTVDAAGTLRVVVLADLR